jgi:hypothetical protein
VGGVRKTWWTAVLVAAVLSFGAACSNGDEDSSAPTSVAGSGATTVVTTSIPAATSTPPTTTSGLSGTWSGDYQQTSPNTSSGSFTIRWQQSGSGLTGTITIPGVCPPGCPITATLTGNNISFGVVAGGSINYTGTVTGSTMAGTYAAADGSARGTWNATRTG